MDQQGESQQEEKLPRGAKRRARTRADLLMAARKVFAARGYHDATITEITETAAVGVGTFYLHFRDKEAIFTTVLEEGLDAIRQQVVEEIAHHDQPSLPVLIRAVFHRVYEQRDIIRIARMGEGGAVPRSRGPDMLVEMFMGFLEHAPDLAPFSEEEIPLLASLLEGLMDRAFHCWWDEQDEPGPDLMADRVLHVMKYGFPASLFQQQPRPFFTSSQRSEERH
ncbi:MAG: TetR/AcrR family transcriptional regulator [Chloroflexi bacterium]|nr:TetR/AcrR family transcriptional regulator [Chloroflexota bacterium]